MSYSSVETVLPGVIVARISGPIVTCLTSASIRMTTSPVRWIIPKTGGFSLANVPAPAPPSAAGTGRAALFPDRFGMALVPGHDVDLVALDLAAEGDLGLPQDHPLPQRGRHPLGVVGVEVELLGDLLVGEVQPHEVEQQDPDP